MKYAGIAQLVERCLAKAKVAGSSPVSRSRLAYVDLSFAPMSGVYPKQSQRDGTAKLNFLLYDKLITNQIGRKQAAITQAQAFHLATIKILDKVIKTYQSTHNTSSLITNNCLAKKIKLKVLKNEINNGRSNIDN